MGKQIEIQLGGSNLGIQNVFCDTVHNKYTIQFSDEFSKRSDEYFEKFIEVIKAASVGLGLGGDSDDSKKEDFDLLNEDLREFPDFRVGDTVYVPSKGVITAMDCHGLYQMEVSMTDSDRISRYPKSGVQLMGADGSSYPVVSFTPWDPVNGGLSQVRPIVFPKEGEMIYVKATKQSLWCPYFCSHVEEDRVFVYYDQKRKSPNSFFVSEWSLENPLK